MSRSSTASLVSRLPSDGAVIVYIDFRALRNSGILSLLSASKVMQEPEYRSFVDQTGFNYVNDLDSVLISFHPSATYFLLRGRFDWKSLKDYTVTQGGSCYNTLCKMGGSTPDRKISYYPFQRDMMALAVSADDSAVTEIQTRTPARKFEVPKEPVWLLVPIGAIKQRQNIPNGAKVFARALQGADAVLLSAAPEGGQIGLRMDATCRTQAAAASLANQLRDATAQLRDLIARENQTPNPRDLSGVLVAGAFEQKDAHVLGRWPIDRAFLDGLAGSGL